MDLLAALARWFAKDTALAAFVGDLRVGKPRRSGRGVALEIGAASTMLSGTLALELEPGGTLTAPLLVARGRIADLALGPARLRDVGVQASLGPTRGHVKLLWGRSHARIDLLRGRPERITASIVAMDVALPPATMTVSKGTTFALDLSEGHHRSLHGQIRASELTLVHGARPFVPGYKLTDVRGELVVDAEGLALRKLTAALYGGTLRGEATVRRSKGGRRDVTAAFSIAHAGRTLLERLARESVPPLPVTLPEGSSLSATIAVQRGGTVGCEAAIEAGRSRVDVFASIDAAGDIVRSKVSGTVVLSEVLATGAAGAPWRVADDAVAELNGALRGSARTRTFEGTLHAPRIAIHHDDYPGFVVENVRVEVSATPLSIVFGGLRASLCGGTASGSGRVDLAVQDDRVVVSGGSTHLELRALDALQVPFAPGRHLGDLARGKVFAEVDLRREGDGAIAGEGRASLVSPEYVLPPAARGVLERVGLPLPAARGAGPAEAAFVLGEGGIHIDRIAARVEGIDLEGAVSVSGDELRGLLRVHLLRGYLSKSAVLLAPRLLSGAITIPVTLGGTLHAPRVEADVVAALEGMVRRGRVGDVVRSLRRRAGSGKPA